MKGWTCGVLRLSSIVLRVKLMMQFHGAMQTIFYQTIDQIQEGGAPFKSIKLCYNGLKPPTPPHWMEEEYELNVRDVLHVIRQQLAMPDFDGNIEYVPYQEFDEHGD